MDLVVTYVNSSDKEWRTKYEQACKENGKHIDSDKNRYREFVAFKYWLRAVQKNMPFVCRIILVVQSRSQVPEYVKESRRLKVVLHEDFIPKEFLPTFNSNTIELFIHRIEGLSEKFIYSNDDLLPVRRLHKRDFFIWGVPRLRLRYVPQFITGFRQTLKSTENLVIRILGMDPIVPNNWFLRDGHTMQPQRVSVWKELFRRCCGELLTHVTTFRSTENYTQQLSQYWFYFTGNYEKRKFSPAYYAFNKLTIDDILYYIENGRARIVCINDSMCNDYEYTVAKLNDWLEKTFPKKSRYEK